MAEGTGLENRHTRKGIESSNLSLSAFQPSDVGLHIALLSWVALMLGLAWLRPETYYRLVQEDAIVEWLTVFLFLGAAVIAFARRAAHRRPGDLLIALFCIVAAGEEISWGQRLLAYVPSEAFLARNAQQEANLHNLVEAFGQPKWTLIAVLAGYGLVLPVIARFPRGARLLERTRTTPPPAQVAVWFLIAIVIEVAYPVRFTGEWAEAIAGAAFAWGISHDSRVAGVVGSIALLLAAAVSSLAARPSAKDDARVRCARFEATRMRSALAATEYVSELGGRVHRRVGTLWPDGRVARVVRVAVDSSCAGEDSARLARRRAYGIDPWGNAYWIRIGDETGAPARISVYSFGPNRRRDHDRIGAPAGDDIVADGASGR